MANGKKSFIFYTSWKIWLDGLTSLQKGMWLDWVMAYTNDENPNLPQDPVVKMACLIAKETLKADLRKYEEKCERFRQVGKQYKPNTEQTLPNTETSKTDFGGDNDNDNDNDNDKEKEKEVKEKEIISKIILKDDSYHFVYEDELKEYERLYPNLDVKQEVLKMEAWCSANFNNRKTKTGIRRFINGWLNRSTDKSKSSTNNQLVRKTDENTQKYVDNLSDNFEKL